MFLDLPILISDKSFLIQKMSMKKIGAVRSRNQPKEFLKTRRAMPLARRRAKITTQKVRKGGLLNARLRKAFLMREFL